MTNILVVVIARSVATWQSNWKEWTMGNAPKGRNFSMAEYFERCYAEVKPEFHFASGKFKDFGRWKKGLKSKLL